MSSQKNKIENYLFKIDGSETVKTDDVTDFLNQLLVDNEKQEKRYIPINFNVSVVKDCQDLLDKLIVNLDGLSFYDAKYIAGRLVDEISKKSMVSVSHSC